jgi:hypothetical protein
MEFCCLQVNGWNWRTSSSAKLARCRKPKAERFRSYVEYGPNTNVSNTMEKQVMLKEVTYEVGVGWGVKEGS